MLFGRDVNTNVHNTLTVHCISPLKNNVCFSDGSSVVVSCVVGVLELEEISMCCSLFPLSPLLTQCSGETGSVGEERDGAREEWGGGCVCQFAYVILHKNVKTVDYNLSLNLIISAVFP